MEKFYSQAPQVFLTVDSEEVGEKMDKINRKYDIDISELIIRVFTDELKIEEIPEFLKREFDLEEKKAQEISEEFKEKIVVPVAERIHFLDPNPEKNTISLKKEKEMLLDIFENDLITELKNHSIIRDSVNTQIFRILGTEGDLNFKKDLEKNLFKNQESLTSAQFRIEDKPTRPSVSNWIKHYIKQKGSEMPDNMKIADFLVNSPNAKKLNSQEKDLVEKVLLIYRNLKFFPESMPDDEGENWQIIPLDEEQPKIEKRKTETSRENQRPQKEEYSAPGDEDEKEDEKKEEKNSSEKIAELEEMAQKYKKNSLERKAIEKEIEKIKEK